MKWVTHEHVRADRVTSPWLIRRFVDPQAEFLFVPRDRVTAMAERELAIPFDVQGVELGHHGKECTFEAILKQYKLTGDAALVLLGKIVNGADTDNTLWDQPEGPGLSAIADGFLSLGLGDDHEVLAKSVLGKSSGIPSTASEQWCQSGRVARKRLRVPDLTPLHGRRL